MHDHDHGKPAPWDVFRAWNSSDVSVGDTLKRYHGSYLGLTTRQKLLTTAVAISAALIFNYFLPGYLGEFGKLPAILYTGSTICFLIILGLRFGWRQLGKAGQSEERQVA